MPLAPGTKLDGYEVLAPIGAGGMGEVYRARDLTLKRDVAIKVLPAFVSNDPDRLRRFEQEAQAAAALNHPNILAVYQFGSYNGSPYLVSELLAGSTLRDALSHGPFALRKVIDTGVQIAHGLAAAHDKGIVHRDLKPENLFVSKDGRVKILDFGLAKLIQPLDSPPQSPFAAAASQPGSIPTSATRSIQTDPGLVMGTAAYMAPEQVRGASVDHRADIFAFGAILHELLAGKRAFQRPTAAETMAAILNSDPPAISSVVPATPPGLQRVVHRCLEKSPEQRFQSASDLAFALEALSDSGSSASLSIASTKRSHWIIPTLSAAILLTLAATFFVWWHLPQPVPVIESITQLTNDALPKNGNLMADSNRVYFDEGPIGTNKIAQVSFTGGKTAIVDTKVQNPSLSGVASDGSALLVQSGFSLLDSGDNDRPLFSIPLPAGDPRRVGDLNVQSADLFPDGRIVYTQTAIKKGSGAKTTWFVADKDGSNSRQILSLPGYSGDLWVSPDGQHILISVIGSPRQLLIISPDGTGLRQIRKLTPGECCFNWTPDQKYLVYLTYDANVSDIWALPLQSGFHRPAKPVQLTFGPLPYGVPYSSRDGRHIFTIGTRRRGELVRYDPQSHQFLPILNGISATDPVWSADGKWVAYLEYPSHTLWRAHADGSDPVQLTYPPTIAVWPYISPDGSKITFASNLDTYLVDSTGGQSQKIVDDCRGATWSPDGTRLVCNSNRGVKLYDLRTKQASIVPGGERLLGPYWISQDAIVAANPEATHFSTYDFKTQKWSDFLTGHFVNWFVAPDLKYFYITTAGTDSTVGRILLAAPAHHVETLGSLKDFHRVINNGLTDLKVSPDGSPVFSRDIGSQEVYSLNVRWPN
jgi:serine/threonine protein kinase